MDTTPEAKMNMVGQQLSYRLDYTSQEILKEYVSQAWPIGSVYSNLTDSRNPRVILGYGTWTAIEGEVIVGYKSGDSNFGTAGDSIGAVDHTLTTDEMPAHSHTNSKLQNLGGGANLGFVAGGWVETAATDSAGGNNAHNNIQPSRIAYVWYRSA